MTKYEILTLIISIFALITPLIIVRIERKNRIKEEAEREEKRIKEEAEREEKRIKEEAEREEKRIKEEAEREKKREIEREEKRERLRQRLIDLMKEVPADYDLIHRTYNDYRDVGGNGFIEKQVIEFLWGSIKT